MEFLTVKPLLNFFPEFVQMSIAVLLQCVVQICKRAAAFGKFLCFLECLLNYNHGLQNACNPSQLSVISEFNKTYSLFHHLTH